MSGRASSIPKPEPTIPMITAAIVPEETVSLLAMTRYCAPALEPGVHTTASTPDSAMLTAYTPRPSGSSTCARRL